MNFVALYALLLQLGLVVSNAFPVVSGSMVQNSNQNKCRSFSKDNLRQIRCRRNKLKKLDNFDENIEVLDLAENRIKILNNASLSRYGSLKYLYLQDNRLGSVKEGAFDHTKNLELLDLSKNDIFKLSKSLFQLQYLRNLYLSNNRLENTQLDVSNVLSPLQKIDLSHNEFTNWPQLGPLNDLEVYNLSKNSIGKITVDDIAPMCSLKELDITENPIGFDQSTCECYEFEKWIKLRNITVYRDRTKCPISHSCNDSSVEFSNHTLFLYNNCETALAERIRIEKARTMWFWVILCTIFILGLTFIVMCCIYCKNKRNKSKGSDIPESTDNENTEKPRKKYSCLAWLIECLFE